VDNLRWIRRELDEFDPDLVVILGRRQYENFREDCVPAFQVCAHDEFVAQPHAHGPPNSWDEPPSTSSASAATRRPASASPSRADRPRV